MSRGDSEERDDVTSVDRQDLDPALSAMAWEDTGEREYVILNNQTPPSRFRAVLRKLRKRLLGFAPVMSPLAHLLEPTRRTLTEQAAVVGCAAALIAGGVTASGPDTLHRTYQTPVPLLASLPQATAYVERVPAPLSTQTQKPRQERPAVEGRPTKVIPSGTPSSTPSPSSTKEPKKESGGASATTEPAESPTPTLEPTPTPDAPPTSDEPAAETPSKPGVKADVDVDLDELDVDVDVELGGVDVEIDLDVGSVLGALTS